MSIIQSRWLLATLVLSAIGFRVAPAEAAAEVEVSGPITGGQHGAPFSAPTVDLEPYGYVAEEFFLAGSASGYQMTPGSKETRDGRWKT